jgi:DNA polymerase
MRGFLLRTDASIAGKKSVDMMPSLTRLETLLSQIRGTRARPGLLRIDFEFRSGTDIDLGLPQYFADEDAAPLCMAWRYDDGMAGIWIPEVSTEMAEALSDQGFNWSTTLPDHIVEWVTAGRPVAGWNVMFEWHAWNLHCVPDYGFPPLAVGQLIDTMALAAAMNLPQALGKCGPVLGLDSEHLKSPRGKQLIKLLCCPQPEPEVKPLESYARSASYKAAQTRHRTWLARGGRWLNNIELLLELYLYCEQDVVAEQAIAKKLRVLSDWEQAVWIKTQEINLRGVPICAEEITNISEIVEREKLRLNEELARLTGGAVTAGSEAAKLRSWINGRLLCPIDDLTADTVEKTLLRKDLDPVTRRALEIRAEVSQTSTAKMPKMLIVMAPDGTLKNMHIYHGASTGRDASRGGVNLQNLSRPPLKKKEIPLALEILGSGDYDLASMIYGDQLMGAAVSCVRGVIKAPPGWDFIDADFSSVENRVAAWLADQMDKLDMFAQGLDEYKTFAASSLFGIPYEEVTDDQRQMSKAAVLGCMFGQGWKGLIDYAAGYGVEITEDRAKEIVKAYRTEYKRVQTLWYKCADAAVTAVENPGEWVRAGSKIKLMCHKNFLWMKLPSGRLIAWAAPRVEMRKAPWTEQIFIGYADDGTEVFEDKPVYKPTVTVEQTDSMTRQWRREPLIGSSIFQSAVQATARDLLMFAMFTLEDAGYPVVLRIHDELLNLVPQGFGSVEEVCTLMCVKPAWAEGLPLAAEGWRDTRFHK